MELIEITSLQGIKKKPDFPLLTKPTLFDYLLARHSDIYYHHLQEIHEE